jgi:cupin 2 domain-containing protein
MKAGNLFAEVPHESVQEQITTLLAAPNVRIERIVSCCQASPTGLWYDQAQPELVIVLAGAARLRFECEAAVRTLTRGDFIHIPAHIRHRVEWTDENEPTIWLAVHYS